MQHLALISKRIQVYYVAVSCLGNYCTYQSQLCVNKYVSQALYQMLQTTKMKYGKLLSLPRLTICILRHNPPPWIALAPHIPKVEIVNHYIQQF